MNESFSQRQTDGDRRRGGDLEMKKNHTSHQHHTDSETPMGHNFEQFQRLSAYFDGEATPAERKEIQHLLDTDPQVKQQYQQLRQLKQALQLLPIPTSISAQYLGQRYWRGCVVPSYAPFPSGAVGRSPLSLWLGLWVRCRALTLIALLKMTPISNPPLP